MADLRAATPEHRRQHVQLIQMMEMLGIFVAEGIIDLDIVEKSLGSFVAEAWVIVKPSVTELRGHFNDPYRAEHFQWLAEILEKRAKQTKAAPAYVRLQGWRA